MEMGSRASRKTFLDDILSVTTSRIGLFRPLVEFCMFNFKIVYLTQFSTDSNNLLQSLVSKSKLRYAFSKTREILKIKQKTFVLFLIKRRHFFGTLCRCQSSKNEAFKIDFTHLGIKIKFCRTFSASKCRLNFENPSTGS